MSKEQTPITAEELFSKIWEMINDDDNRRKELSISTRTILDIEHKIDEAFNAKVLEALEREFTGLLIMKPSGDLLGGKPFFKTEVKPKYER